MNAVPWECWCGDTGLADSLRDALTAAYRHRDSHERPTLVLVPREPVLYVGRPLDYDGDLFVPPIPLGLAPEAT